MIFFTFSWKKLNSLFFSLSFDFYDQSWLKVTNTTNSKYKPKRCFFQVAIYSYSTQFARINCFIRNTAKTNSRKHFALKLRNPPLLHNSLSTNKQPLVPVGQKLIQRYIYKKLFRNQAIQHILFINHMIYIRTNQYYHTNTPPRLLAWTMIIQKRFPTNQLYKPAL